MDSLYEATGGMGVEGAEGRGRGQVEGRVERGYDEKGKERSTYQYEDTTTSQRTWTAELQHPQAMTLFQSRQEQVQTPWLHV